MTALRLRPSPFASPVTASYPTIRGWPLDVGAAMTFSGPGGRLFGDDLAPFYALEVEGEWVWSDITRYIKSVEFEQTVDMCDRLKILIENPGHGFDVLGDMSSPENRSPDFTSHKVFLPGNQVDLLGGYGAYSRSVHLGRAKLWRHAPRFPRDEHPTLDIIGYDMSKAMMGERTDITIAAGGNTQRTNNDDNEGNVYPEMTHSEAVRVIADKYGFIADVDDSDRVDNLFQKRDMNDYAFVRGLANVNSREFWVDYDYYGTQSWVLHWKNPAQDDRPLYTFRYRDGNKSSLLEFEPEYTLDDGPIELRVMYFDRRTGQWEYLSEDSGQDATADEDPRFRRGTRRGSRRTVRRRSDGTERAGEARRAIAEEITSASRLRLAAGGHSIDVVSDRHFGSIADALDFAKRWFTARRNNFILGTGKVVGVETLRPRQVHRLEGLGPRLSGDYYFILVRHSFVPDVGYTCEFKCHKIVGS